MAEIQKLYVNNEQIYPETSSDAIIDPSTGEKIDFANIIGSTSIININYSDLVNLKATASLKPNQKYRIIDYETTSSQYLTSCAGHKFDLIVEALSTNELNEDAKACNSDRDTAGYFNKCKLAAWDIKYCLENDSNRFGWASSSGKGVIYYLKDERNNECSYDFKNIKTNGRYTFELYDGTEFSV